MHTDDGATPPDDEFALRLAWPERNGVSGAAEPEAVPSEPSEQRPAADDPGQHTELRKLRSALDDLRVEVAGLRQAVLERPSLERMSSEVVALRSDVASLVESSGTTALAPLVEEVALLRAEVTGLRRRIGLRADGAGAPLDEARLEQISEAVATRVADQIRAEGRTGSRR